MEELTELLLHPATGVVGRNFATPPSGLYPYGSFPRYLDSSMSPEPLRVVVRASLHAIDDPRVRAFVRDCCRVQFRSLNFPMVRKLELSTPMVRKLELSTPMDEGWYVVSRTFDITLTVHMEVLNRDPPYQVADAKFCQVISSRELEFFPNGPHWVRGALHRVVTHEVDECLLVDGERVWDPHRYKDSFGR